jgi:hypothetical protein
LDQKAANFGTQIAFVDIQLFSRAKFLKPSPAILTGPRIPHTVLPAGTAIIQAVLAAGGAKIVDYRTAGS